MPLSFKSAFNYNGILTKKDFCLMLNLNTARPGLEFSDAEISRAYRRRILRFHPDKQASHSLAIPNEIGCILINDLTQAKDHLLKGEDNIPGDKFSFQSIPQTLDAGFQKMIDILNTIDAQHDSIRNSITWLSRFSHDFWLVILMATYSNNQLNIRYLNSLLPQLAPLKAAIPFFQEANIPELLRSIQKSLQVESSADTAQILEDIQARLPAAITNHEKYPTFVDAVINAKKGLKRILTDDLIGRVEHLLEYWPGFIRTVPSWSHIVHIYFLTMFTTANSVPKTLNAIHELSKIIINHKGLSVFLAALPAIILINTVMIPVNIVAQLLRQLSWVAAKACFQVILNSSQLLLSTIMLFNSLVSNSTQEPISSTVLSMMLNVLNLTVRLSVDILVETVDVFIFIFSNQAPLSQYVAPFNRMIDLIVAFLNTARQKPQQTFQIREVIQIQEKQAIEDRPVSNDGFFSSKPLHNANDVWLDEILNCIAHSIQHTASMQEVSRPVPSMVD